MNCKWKAVVAAGGTGGHIIPALAIIEELQRRDIEILFIGNRNSMESKLVQAKNINFEAIDVQKMYRKITWKHIKFPFKLMLSIIRSREYIRYFKPDFFVGTGGFVSGPVGLAAKLESVPIFLQEQNSYPGVTTKFLSKYARKVFLGNEGAKKYLKNDKTCYTRNPINDNVRNEENKIEYHKYNMSSDSFKIFIIGGSQGSVAINTVVLEIVDELLKEKNELFWQTGKHQFLEIKDKTDGRKGVHCFSFTNEIGKFYNSANMAISRAGAITLAELEQKELPSVLIPLPTSAENHQFYNAIELQNRKIAIVIEQKNLSAKNLLQAIYKIKNNYAEYTFENKEESFSNPAKIIVDEIENIMREEC